MPDTSAGFRFSHRLCGAPATVRKFYAKDTETLSAGDLLNVENGEVDLAATNDTALIGVATQTLACTDSTTQIEVIVDEDAVYSVYDPNARLIGATLDISGATGAMTVTTSSNADVIVVANSSAAERTLVMIVRAEHVIF